MANITRRENILKAYRHEVPYFIPSITDVDMCIPSALEEGPTCVGKSKDGWGVTWLLLEGQMGPMPDETAPVVLEDVTQWKEVVHFPDVETYDWAAAAAADTASWDRENKISNVILVNGMWERFDALCGFENALCNLLLEPEASYELMSAIADHKITYMKKIKEYYNPDKIQMHDDYGSEKSMFFSVDTWREIMKPNLKKIVDACHELGMLYEHHSCGYIVPILDDFVELGIDAWNPVQNPNNPNALIEQYQGKLTFVGGFNDRLFVHPNATDAAKKESIDATIAAFGPRGCWVPMPSVGEDYIGYAYKAIYNYNKPAYDALGLSGEGFEEPTDTTYKSVYEKAEDMK